MLLALAKKKKKWKGKKTLSFGICNEGKLGDMPPFRLDVLVLRLDSERSRSRSRSRKEGVERKLWVGGTAFPPPALSPTYTFWCKNYYNLGLLNFPKSFHQDRVWQIKDFLYFPFEIAFSGIVISHLRTPNDILNIGKKFAWANEQRSHEIPYTLYMKYLPTNEISLALSCIKQIHSKRSILALFFVEKAEKSWLDDNVVDYTWVSQKWTLPNEWSET